MDSLKIEHKCLLKKHKRCAFCELGVKEFPVNHSMEQLKETLEMSLSLLEGLIIFKNILEPIQNLYWIEAEYCFKLNVNETFAVIKDDIDIRTESLKADLDMIRDALFKELEDQQHEIIRLNKKLNINPEVLNLYLIIIL